MVRNLALLVHVLMASNAVAQLPHGKLDWIYPPGGQVGTELDVTIGGADVDIAERIVFSHPGITAVQKRTVATEFEAARPVEHQFRLVIAESVTPGIYDAWAVGRFGESTPRAFRVGTSVERKESSDHASIEKALQLPMNQVVNGRASPNSSDFYRINLSDGQRVLIQLEAFAIDSQLDATLVVRDAKGKQLEKSRDHRGRDPFIDFTAPENGDYFIQVYDFTYQGGNNHFYRLKASTEPVVEFVFPPAIEPGKTESVTLYGWNFPNSAAQSSWAIKGRRMESVVISVTAPIPDALRQTDKPMGAGPAAVEVSGFYARFQGSPFFVAYADAPVVKEVAKPASSQIQTVDVPCEVAGQFYPERDDDRYEFRAKAGDVLWLEVFSQRLGCATDPFLLIQRVEKKEDGSETSIDIAEVDDGPKRPGGYSYETPSGDPKFRLTVPRDGTYRVLVRDLIGQSRARPQNVYRLAIRRERPDYHLLVTPTSPFSPDGTQPLRWSNVLRRGGSIALPITVLRVDRFNGPIDVTVAGLPQGLAAPTVTIGPGQDSGTVVVSASETAPTWWGPIGVIGNALCQGRPVIRSADFATLVWDAPAKNAKKTPRLTRGTLLGVSDDTSPLRIVLRERPNLVTCRGGKLTTSISLQRNGAIKDKIVLAGQGLPKGVKSEVKLEDGKDRGKLHLTVEPGAKAGRYSFCLTGKPKVSYRRLPERVTNAEVEKKLIEARVAELGKSQTEAAAAVTKAENHLKTQNELLAAADEGLAILNRTTTSSPEKLAAAREALEEATQSVASASAARDMAAAASTAAQQKHVAAQEALKRVTERIGQLNENAKPADRGVFVASNAVTIDIAEHPVRLAVENEFSLAQGATHTLKVGIERLYGFADLVRIEPAIDDATKMTVEPIEVPQENVSGELIVRAAADSPVGRHKLDLNVKLKFNGFELEFKQPVFINLAAALPSESDPVPKP